MFYSAIFVSLTAFCVPFLRLIAMCNSYYTATISFTRMIWWCYVQYPRMKSNHQCGIGRLYRLVMIAFRLLCIDIRNKVRSFTAKIALQHTHRVMAGIGRYIIHVLQCSGQFEGSVSIFSWLRCSRMFACNVSRLLFCSNICHCSATIYAISLIFCVLARGAQYL